MTPQAASTTLGNCANRNGHAPATAIPLGDAGWHKRLKTIPLRATKPSLIITAPDREKYRQGLSAYQFTAHAHDNQPAVISDDIASWKMR